jgi:hypothetical protein
MINTGYPIRYTEELLTAIEAIDPLNTHSWLGIVTEETVIQNYLDKELAKQQEIDPEFTQAMLIDDLRELASNLTIFNIRKESRAIMAEVNHWWDNECDPAGGHGLESHI